MNGGGWRWGTRSSAAIWNVRVRFLGRGGRGERGGAAGGLGLAREAPERWRHGEAVAAVVLSLLTERKERGSGGARREGGVELVARVSGCISKR
jgi:hypothetical protein